MKGQTNKNANPRNNRPKKTPRTRRKRKVNRETPRTFRLNAKLIKTRNKLTKLKETMLSNPTKTKHTPANKATKPMHKIRLVAILYEELRTPTKTSAKNHAKIIKRAKHQLPRSQEVEMRLPPRFKKEKPKYPAA
jgi:hypothetical protein